MNRRTLLLSAGTLSSTLAGCVSFDANDADGDATDGTGNGSAPPGASNPDLLAVGEQARGPMPDDPDAEWRVSVEDTFAQTSAYHNTHEPEQSFREASSHFLFAEIDASLPEGYTGSYTIPYDVPGRFTAIVDGEEHEPPEDALRADDDVGAFAGYGFEVAPEDELSEAIVRWEVGDRTHEWAVDQQAREQLLAHPRTGNVSLSVPEQATGGDTVTISLTAENVGVDDGRIRAGFYRRWNKNVRRFSTEVAAGERHTWEADVEVQDPRVPIDYEFHAVTADGDADTATLRVSPSESE